MHAIPDSGRFFIDQTSIQQYQSYVVPEALPLVQSGQWVLEVDSEGKEAFSDESFLEDEYSAEAVAKILESQPSFVRQVDTFQAQTFNGYAVSYSMAGMIARVYPSVMENEKFKEQAFREVVSLSYSSELPSHKWLTYRFLGDEEDVVFTYSPVLKKVRRITASNRSDLIFGSELNLNDLNGASHKIEELTIVKVQPGLYALPMRKNAGRGGITQDCESPLVAPQMEGEAAAAAVEGGKAYLLGAGWLPDDVSYRLTKLLRVEATVQDAYALFHQIVLYIDPQTGLVPYKIALGRKGEPLKFVMTVYGTLDGVSHVDSIAVKNLQSDMATLLTFKSHSVCTDKAAQTLLDEFTPKALAQ